MASYAKGKKAFGFCDRCGFRYDLKDLKPETVNLVSTNLLVCEECWDSDHPQNMLGRIKYDDPQALRNPRPLGGISGRDLPAAYRSTFESAVIDTTPYDRVNGWSASNGILTWNESNSSMNLVSNPDSGSPGDPYIWQGLGLHLGFPEDYVNIDSSVYKYVVTEFTVNRFPLFEQDDRYFQDFQGELFWYPAPFSNPPLGQQKASFRPVFTNVQVSDGFEQANKSMASRFKIVFDMSSNPDWTGTIPIIRLDYFDPRNEAGLSPDFDAGDIDIHYIEVVAFHNIDL